MSTRARDTDAAAELHAELAATVAEIGDEARRWARRLPSLVEQTVDAWDLRVEGPLPAQGVTSRVVAAATADGVPAVLKLIVPHEESRTEADVLARWDGDGAVRLLRRSPDGFVLLLERCVPGDDLWTVARDARLDAVSGLLPRLWRSPTAAEAGLPRLADTAARWGREAERRVAHVGLPSESAAALRTWIDELVDTAPEARVLHGDLHPGNVLDAGPRGWVAIDPKPWVGDPAFDLAQLLVNELEDRPGPGVGAELGVWTERLGAALALDPARILRWAAVKAVGWGAPPEKAVALVRAARDHDRSHR